MTSTTTPKSEAAPKPTYEDIVAENEDLKRKLAAAEKAAYRAGWLVTAKNPTFNGKTAGYQFRNGKTFIPSVNTNDEAFVRSLCADFGYTSEFVSNYADIPAAVFQATTTNMIESLMSPQLMG